MRLLNTKLFRESVFEIIWGILYFCLFYNRHVLCQKYDPISLQRVENYSTYVVFCSFSAKKWSQINFFFLNFPRYRAFFAYFLQKKKTCVFFQKYPTIGTTNFENVDFKRVLFFLASFFAVCGSLLADIIPGFWPKKSKDIWRDILFFFVISFFFLLKKVSGAEIGQKKKDITFKVKDITFQFDFRPVF